jgi:hypothetical protein
MEGKRSKRKKKGYTNVKINGDFSKSFVPQELSRVIQHFIDTFIHTYQCSNREFKRTRTKKAPSPLLSFLFS